MNLKKEICDKLSGSDNLKDSFRNKLAKSLENKGIKEYLNNLITQN